MEGGSGRKNDGQYKGHVQKENSQQNLSKEFARMNNQNQQSNASNNANHRNLKSRKLYTSIGAYSTSQGQKKPQQSIVQTNNSGSVAINGNNLIITQSQAKNQKVYVQNKRSSLKPQSDLKEQFYTPITQTQNIDTGSQLSAIVMDNGNNNSSMFNSLLQSQQFQPQNYESRDGTGMNNNNSLVTQKQGKKIPYQIKNGQSGSALGVISRGGGSQMAKGQKLAKTQVGNYLIRNNESDSKEYLEQSFHTQPNNHDTNETDNIDMLNSTGQNKKERISMSVVGMPPGKQRLQTQLKTLGGSSQKQQIQRNMQIGAIGQFENQKLQRPHSSMKPNNNIQQHQPLMGQKRAASMVKKSHPQQPSKDQNNRGSLQLPNGWANNQNPSGRRGTALVIQQQNAQMVQSFNHTNQSRQNSKGKNTQQQNIVLEKTKFNGQEKQLIIGKTQRLDKLAAYQNMVVGHEHVRDRRIARGSTGIETADIVGTKSDLSGYLSKDQREMRTASANAGITNTELLMEDFGPNIANHNLNYQKSQITQHQGGNLLSGGGSGGVVSSNSAIAKKVNKSILSNTGQLKNSKRNFQITLGLSNEKLLAAANNLQNQSTDITPEQLAIIQNIDSIRSGKNKKQINMIQRNSALDVPIKQISQEERKINTKNSVRQSFVSVGNTQHDQKHLEVQTNKQSVTTNTTANRTHQQSMQKFLQQNIQNSQSHQNSTQGKSQSKNSKKQQQAQNNAQRKNNGPQIVNILSQGQNSVSISRQAPQHSKYVQKSSGQKIQKKQIIDGALLSSDRGSQPGRSRGAQTSIGNAKAQQILSSNQVKMGTNQKNNTSQSLSRSRISKDKRQQQQQIPTMANKKNNAQPLRQLSNLIQQSNQNSNVMIQLVNFSGTPGITQTKQKLLAPNPTNMRKTVGGRNFYSQIQNTNKSNQIEAKLLASSSSGQGLPQESTGVKQTITSFGMTNDFNKIVSKRDRSDIQSLQLALQLSQQSNNDDIQQYQAEDASSQNTTAPGQQVVQYQLQLTQQQAIQIKLAEKAVKDMRDALNQGPEVFSADGNLILDIQDDEDTPSLRQNIRLSLPQPHQSSSSQNTQSRPKSQNDVQWYLPSADEQQIPPQLSPPSALQKKSMTQKNTIQQNTVPKNQLPLIDLVNQNRILSQNRVKKDSDEAIAINENNISERSSLDEIDKTKFLGIVEQAHDKILNTLHPRVSNALQQVKLMFSHMIEQIEQKNQLEMQELLQTESEQRKLFESEIQRLREENGQLQKQNLQLRESNKAALASKLRQGIDEDERQNIGRNVIDELKNNLPFTDEGSESMEKLLEGIPMIKNNHVKIDGEDVQRYQPQRAGSRLDHIDKRRGFDDELTEDGIMDPANMTNVSKYEEEHKRESDSAMEFDPVEDDEEDPRDGQQSYFSSRIHSSSDTINSEIEAYQDAIKFQFGGKMPEMDQDVDLNINNIDPTIFQSTSKADDVKNTSKVPQLDFMKIGEIAEDYDQPDEGINEMEFGAQESDIESPASHVVEELIEQLEIQNQGIPKPQSKMGFQLPGGSNGGLGLNLAGVKKQTDEAGKPKDFHEEFMAHFNEFSESWRRQIERQHGKVDQ